MKVGLDINSISFISVNVNKLSNAFHPFHFISLNMAVRKLVISWILWTLLSVTYGQTADNATNSSEELSNEFLLSTDFSLSNDSEPSYPDYAAYYNYEDVTSPKTTTTISSIETTTDEVKENEAAQNGEEISTLVTASETTTTEKESQSTITPDENTTFETMIESIATDADESFAGELSSTTMKMKMEYWAKESKAATENWSKESETTMENWSKESKPSMENWSKESKTTMSSSSELDPGTTQSTVNFDSYNDYETLKFRSFDNLDALEVMNTESTSQSDTKTTLQKFPNQDDQAETSGTTLKYTTEKETTPFKEISTSEPSKDKNTAIPSIKITKMDAYFEPRDLSVSLDTETFGKEPEEFENDEDSLEESLENTTPENAKVAEERQFQVKSLDLESPRLRPSSTHILAVRLLT